MKRKLLICICIFFAGILHAQRGNGQQNLNGVSSTLCWYTQTTDSFAGYFIQNILDYHVDIFGNSYTAGYTYAPFGGWNTAWNMVIQKFDKNGKLKWRKLWDAQQLYGNGDTYRSCFCNSITSDTAGNIYITGNYACNKLIMDSITLKSSDNYSKGFIAKLDSNGKTKWAINYSNPNAINNSFRGGSDIQYLNDKQIFVFLYGSADLLLPTGAVQNLAGMYNVVQIDKNGNFIKVTGLDYLNFAGLVGAFNPDLSAWNDNQVALVSPKMHISPKSGKLFLVGTFKTSLYVVYPTLILDSIAPGINGFVAVMDTAKGWQNAFVTYGTNGFFNYNTGQTLPDIIPAFSVDTSDCIYIAARWDAVPAPDFIPKMEIAQGQYLAGRKGSVIAKYDKDGHLKWYNQNSVCFPRSLSVTASNSILMFGEFDDTLSAVSQTAAPLNIQSNGGKDLFLGSVNANGNMNWLQTLGSQGDDYSWFMKSHPCSDNMYYTGSLFKTCTFLGNQLSNSGNKIFVGKYSENGNCNDTTCITASGLGIENYYLKNKLLIFPNPFSSSTTLQANRYLKDATLVLYNSFGQIVKQIKKISGQAIVFHRDNLPGGLYYIRLIQDNQVIATNKLVITGN